VARIHKDDVFATRDIGVKMHNQTVTDRWLLTIPPVFFALGIAISLGAPQDHGAVPANGRQNSGDATAEIKNLIANYAEAVNREPVDLDLASRVWSNAPDVSLIDPLGEVCGWEHIKQDFYEGLMEARFSERTLTPGAIQVHAYGDSAWAEFSWRFIAKSRKDGSSVETNGRETQIYHKVAPHRWVLVHVHYSALSPAGR
jgi:ketosteroid isomerase-like protein